MTDADMTASGPVAADPVPEEDEEVAEADEENTGPVDWRVKGDVILHQSKFINLDELEFDLLAREGQPRKLTEKDVQKRFQALKTNEPTTPVSVLVWLRDPAAEKYMVIGGQHTCKALMMLRDERLRERRPVPEWCNKVNAKVIRPEVDLDTRERLAGDHQCEQSTVENIPISRTAHYISAYLQHHPNDIMGSIVAGVQNTGRKDRPASNKDLRKAYFTFAQLC